MYMKSNLNKAIEAYKKAVYRLAKIIEEGSTEHGRDRMVESTPFDEKKINWFNAIARLECLDETLLPEVCYEVVGENKPNKWLKIAKKEGLKPSQLRRLIRANYRLFTKEKTVDIVLWPKYSVLLENELNKLTVEQKQAALDRIRQSLHL